MTELVLIALGVLVSVITYVVGWERGYCVGISNAKKPQIRVGK